jgi:hypothetical protein
MSFDLDMRLVPDGLEWINHHVSHMRGEGPAWVGASCAQGITGVNVTLSKNEVAPRPCTVRLFFAEPEEIEAGQRLFSIRLQGQEVRSNFDTIREAGGARRTVVQEFHNIPVGEELRVELIPAPESPLQRPILSGLEIVVNK